MLLDKRVCVCFFRSVRLSSIFSKHFRNTFSTSSSATPIPSTQFNVAWIKRLRERSGAPLGECKEALIEATKKHKKAEKEDEIIEAAIDELRKKGISTAAKKAGRMAREGLIAACINKDRTYATLVEVNCETDFCARNEIFKSLVESVAQTTLQQRKSAFKMLSQAQVNSMPFEKNNSTVDEAIKNAVSSIRENIQVRRAAQLQVDATRGGVLGVYVHNAVPAIGQSRLGKSGCIVAISGTVSQDQRDALESLACKIAMHAVAMQPRYTTREQVPQEDLERERQVLVDQAATTTAGKSAQQIEKIVMGRINKFYQENVLAEQTFVVVAQDAKPQPVRVWLKDEASKLGVQDADLVDFVRFAVGEGIQAEEKMSFADEVASKMKV